jgi:hypothetical protein
MKNPEMTKKQIDARRAQIGEAVQVSGAVGMIHDDRRRGDRSKQLNGPECSRHGSPGRGTARKSLGSGKADADG